MQQPSGFSPEKIRKKIYHYCAYQERCHREVKEKLFSFGLKPYEVDEWMAHLIQEGFLSEERYAKAYSGGKFRMKGWGRIKIAKSLEAKGLTCACIKIGLKEIDDMDYVSTLKKLLEKKIAELREETNFEKRHTAARYVIQKGYEADLVWITLRELLPE